MFVRWTVNENGKYEQREFAYPKSAVKFARKRIRDGADVRYKLPQKLVPVIKALEDAEINREYKDAEAAIEQWWQEREAA